MDPEFLKINVSSLQDALPILERAYRTNASTARSFKAHCKDFAATYAESGLSATEQIYLLINPDANRQCKHCGNKLTFFRGPKFGYGEFCSIKCSTSSKQRQLNFEKTSLERYGVKSPKQLKAVTDKMQATNLIKYGHISNLHSGEARLAIRQKISAKIEQSMEKIRTTNLLKYGVKWQTQRSEFIFSTQKKHSENRLLRDEQRIEMLNGEFVLLEKHPDLIHGWQHSCGHKFLSPSISLKCPNCKKHSSDIEQDLYTFLSSVIDPSRIKRHARIFDNSKKEVDFFIADLNIAVELNGCYWHRDEVDAGAMLFKTNALAAKGVTLIHIWDYEWLKDRVKIENFIKSKLDTKKIHGRKCTVREISAVVSNRFLIDHHRQSTAKSQIKLGLFYKDELVSVLTFGKSRYNKKIEWEIIRYCVLPCTTVLGGFAKMLRYFETKFNPASICTYADRAWGHGAVYQKHGFNFLKTTQPGYFWCNSSYDVLSRYETQLSKLPKVLPKFNSMLSESENMIAHRYWKCKNVGNNYFEKHYIIKNAVLPKLTPPLPTS